MTQALVYGGIWREITAFFARAALFISSGQSARERGRAESVNAQAERLLDKYGNAVLRMAYSYLHNMTDAEDIVQETMIRFLNAAPAFESPAHEKAWLLRVAANLSKNRIAYNKIRQSDELNEEITAGEAEDLSFVWEAVKQLPPTQGEVVHLFYHEGYSTAEIAELLRRKEATVRSDLKRARERLRAILKEAYDFE